MLFPFVNMMKKYDCVPIHLIDGSLTCFDQRICPFYHLDESLSSSRGFLWMFSSLLHRNLCKPTVLTLINSAASE